MDRLRLIVLMAILPGMNQAPVNSTMQPSFAIVETTQSLSIRESSLMTSQPLQTSDLRHAMTSSVNVSVENVQHSRTIITNIYSTVRTDSYVLMSTPKANLTNSSGNTNTTINLKVHRWHNCFLLSLLILSLLGLVVNFSFMASICSCNGVPVIILFGICLMLFNILISLYGVGITIYLYQSPLQWSQRFCQGLTSIKLFSLGSSVWTLITLTFHHSIRESTEEERDAVFKGIVYVLEGVMLSGVLAVMAWIKLDSWNYLCAIIEPETTVEWLLAGIELWFYFIAIMLIVRYPVHLIRRRKSSDTDRLKRHQEHPIFIMIISSFLCWCTAYVLTFPHIGIFDFQTAAVVRVHAILFVTVLQPILYSIRGTFCCTGRNPPCKKTKNQSPNDVPLVCRCTGAEPCPACDSEYDVRTRYGNTVFAAESSASDGKQGKVNGRVKETKDVIRKNKKRKKKSNVEIPKAVPRSPEIRTTMEERHLKFEVDDEEDQKENVPLLVNQVAETVSVKTETNQKNHASTDLTPLLDDTDGRKPPKALPDDSPFRSVVEVPIAVSKNRQSEFPSFINLKTATNVDELPKEKKQLTLHDIREDSATTSSVQERVSRGPTFYSIDPKHNEENKANNSSRHDKENNSTNSEVVNDIEKVNAEHKNECKSKSPKKKKGKKKNRKNNSTESLEWDHSCTDSSGSGSLVEESADNKMNDAQSCEKEHNMEWDPSSIDIRITSFDESGSCSPSIDEMKPNSKDDVKNGHSLAGEDTSKTRAHPSTDESSDRGGNNGIEHGINGLKRSEDENSDNERVTIVSLSDSVNKDVESNDVKQKAEKKRKKNKKEKTKHKRENGKIKEEKLKFFKKKKKEEGRVEG